MNYYLYSVMTIYQHHTMYILCLFIFCKAVVHALNDAFQLTSSDIEGASTIACSHSSTVPYPDKSYGRNCGDENIFPTLSWSAGPPLTKSYVLVIVDMNTTEPSFIAWNIPSHVTRVLPDTDWRKLGVIVGKNWKDNAKYDGPCPMEEEDFHCMRLTVYAITEAKLPLDNDDASFDSLNSYLLYLGKKKKILNSASLFALTVPHNRFRATII